MTEAGALLKDVCIPDRAHKRFIEPYTVVRVVLGLLLLLAALLKGHQLATEPFARTGLPGPRWLGVALVEFEFLLGVWLLSGFAAKAASALATLGFCAFVCVSLFRRLQAKSHAAALAKSR